MFSFVLTLETIKEPVSIYDKIHHLFVEDANILQSVMLLIFEKKITFKRGGKAHLINRSYFDIFC